ncbi:MAG TPA: TonB-dependent receptor [Flavobacteriaceae bacterium]|nr:TonB-dependent receptor [Flavobacteriaceae bacterium]
MNPFELHTKALVITLWLFQAAVVYSQEGYINGKITNGSENLPSVKLSIGEINLITNENGEYNLSLKPGTYKMTIAHPDYEIIEQELKIRQGETKTIDFIMTAINRLDEVVLLGSLSNIPRSNLNTAVPVDAFSEKVLNQTGQISLTQMLNLVAPSINISGEMLNEPVTLRGLDPDHVLILLNGTRYHNMAWIYGGGLKGQLGRGSVGNDLNSIPPSSVEKIEVLHDGASAQYGSDAIAGVINIILKESTDRTTAHVQQGQFYKGDGEKFAFGVNHGISLSKKGHKGFLNLSADFRHQAPTHRGGQYDGTVYYPIPDNLEQDEKDAILLADNQKVEERNFNRKNTVDQVGNSKFVVSGLMINGAYPVNNNLEIFWTSAFNQKKVYREQAYRFPKNTRQVNLELYPDGFLPLSKSTTTDITLITGLRGSLNNNWYWDLTGSFGGNTLRSEVSNSNNASQSILGKDAPTNFYNGKNIYEQFTNNLNFSKKFDGLPKSINLFNFCTGIEWRFERYYEKPGEEASWKNYDDTYRKQPGTGGISLYDAIQKSRNNSGIYIDLETELHNRFLINLTGRYEYYSDYGGNLAGKLASRYKLSKNLTLRASVSNGFRAPSLQQRYITSVSETRRNIGGELFISTRGIFPNDHPVVKALGVPSLMAEKSINLSSGFTFKITKNVSLTTDLYWLQLNDRIVLSGMFSRNNNPTLEDILNQYPEFNQVEQVAFFANAINTRTKGVDMVLQGSWAWNTSRLGFILAANFTQTHLYGNIKVADNLPNNSLNTSALLNTEEKVKIEKGQPNSKMILTVNYNIGNIGFVITNTRFGETSIAPVVDANNSIFLSETFSPKIITDVSINYKIKSFVTLNVGVNNLLNVYPDKIKNYENTAEGIRIYSPDGAPYGFNGGYYFINTKFSF